MQVLNMGMNEVKKCIETIMTEMSLERYIPDHLIGIQLGGLCPALMISKKLREPHIHTVEMGAMGEPIFKEDSFEGIVKAREILLIDDICDSGKTLQKTYDHFKHYYPEYRISTAALVYKIHTAQFAPDYCGLASESNAWVQFPWEWNDETY